MLKKTSYRIHRRLRQRMSELYAEHINTFNCARRREMDDLRERYRADENTLYRSWLNRYGACLYRHTQLITHQAKVAPGRLKANHAIPMCLRERHMHARTEKKLAVLEARLLQNYDNLYRDLILRGRRAEAGSQDQCFFDELSILVAGAKDSAERANPSDDWLNDAWAEFAHCLSLSD